MPADYATLQSEGLFISCEGDLQDEVGTYTSNGQSECGRASEPASQCFASQRASQCFGSGRVGVVKQYHLIGRPPFTLCSQPLAAGSHPFILPNPLGPLPAYLSIHLP